MTASLAYPIADQLDERLGYYYSERVDNVDTMLATEPIQQLRSTLFRVSRLYAQHLGIDVRDVLVNYGLSDDGVTWVLDLT